MRCDICRWSDDDKLGTHYEHTRWLRNMLAITIVEETINWTPMDLGLRDRYLRIVEHMKETAHTDR